MTRGTLSNIIFGSLVAATLMLAITNTWGCSGGSKTHYKLAKGRVIKIEIGRSIHGRAESPSRYTIHYGGMPDKDRFILLAGRYGEHPLYYSADAKTIKVYFVAHYHQHIVLKILEVTPEHLSFSVIKEVD